MKEQTFLQENLLKKIIRNLSILILISFFISSKVYSKEKWLIDKEVSKISFEVPVLFATNVIGSFKKINGFVEIDLEDKKNNKAVLSVVINSVESNYEKYRDLFLSPIFFDVLRYPIAVLDTKKFSYQNEKEIELDIELTLKGISKIIKTKLKINRLTNDLVQILGTLELSRTEFNIGSDKWSNTTILKDKIKINSNIFLVKESIE